MAKNWAIAIGINQYNNLPILKYAGGDAEIMSDWFKNEAQFDQVYLFTDNSPPITDGSKPFSSQPNRATLRRFLRTRFDKPFLSPGDNLWFFFSGHGMRQANRDYLMPSDVDPHPDELENSAIPLAYVTERLRRCGADNIVLIMDACRDEGSSKGQGIRLEKQQGVITIASCSPAERSYEIEELKQGSFTYSLLQGLRIHGEGNCATVERLYQYLQYRVPEINRNYRKPRQTPYAVVEPASKYHLILLPDYIQPNLEDVATLRETALTAEAENNLELAETLWHRLVKFDQEKALRALRRIWQKLEQSDVSSRGNDVVRHRNNQSNSRSGIPLNRVTNPTSLPINISRRRLLQISGFTVTGIGLTFIVGKGREWISDSKSKETIRNSSKPESNLEDEVKPDPPINSDLKENDSVSSKQPELFKSDFEVITVNKSGQTISQEPAQAEYFPEQLGNKVTLEMVSIPGGKFQMGTKEEEIERLVKKFDWEYFRSEKPQHEVTVKPFYMGKYPVTQKQWQAVMGNNPSYFKDSPLHPVEKVSWDDAKEFCQKLSEKTGKEYRLPSEAEWEYACRAVTSPLFKGSYPPFHFGETITADLANYRATSTYADEAPGEYREKTTAVGSFPPNAFGLYDMHGNVWEWCEDDWHENYQDAPIDGMAWLSESSSLKVIHGGSWGINPFNCRSAFRYDDDRGGRSNNIGFRVVCVAPRTT